jgi:hypothetical protein
VRIIVYIHLFAQQMAEPYSKSSSIKIIQLVYFGKAPDSLKIGVTLVLHSESSSQSVFPPELKLLIYVG